MNLIAAVDKNWAIGHKNALLVRIPEDMKRFRQMTAGKTVIMGRGTLESLPGGQALAGRQNIVLTRKKDYRAKGAVIAHSPQEALQAAAGCPPEDIYIIGGESVYRQFLPYCDTAYITWIDFAYEADRYFPKLSESEGWELAEESQEYTYYDLEYYFRRYERRAGKMCKVEKST